MDTELKKALDGLKMNFSEAVEAQEKATASLRESVEANAKKRDAVTDEKIEKLQAELDKFEPLNEAMVAIQKRHEQEDAAEKEREARQAERDEQLDRIEARLSRPGMPGGEGEEKKAAYRSAFFDLMRYGRERMQPDRLNVLTISDDTGGGYLAPPEYVQEIIKDISEWSPMRSIARVSSTSANSVQLPRRTGTHTAVWVGEIESRSETTGTAYGLHDVPVHELVADIRFSMANLEDSAFNLEAEARAEFAEQFGVAEGNAMVTGNTVKKPEGFLNAADTNAVNSGSASDITSDGIIDLKHAVKTQYARNGTFVLNRNTLGRVRKLKTGDGQYIWSPGLAVGKPNTIDGDPYVEFPDMPDVTAAAKSVAFGDWMMGYRIIDRMSLSIIRDNLTLASDGQVKFIARRRVGGAVVLPAALAIMTIAA